MKYLRKTVCLLLALCLAAQMVPRAGAQETDPENSRSLSMRFGSETEPHPFQDVPVYWQDDYPDTPYGGGTVATSGCTITCLSMAATYLLGREHLPDELAEQYQAAGADNIARMEAAADALGLHYRKAGKWSAVMAALKHDCLVMILLKDPSPFTDSAHTVLLTGLTPEGKILVNDPNKHNYQRPELKQGFQEGFPEEMLQEGFDGCWFFADTDAARQARNAMEASRLGEHREKHFSQVPLYLQTDYPKVSYSGGSLATSGCTMTCIAMVASYLRQEEILPSDLARAFGSYDASNIQRMEAASVVLDLSYRKTYNWWDVRKAVRGGKLAIVLLGAESDFTNTQHTVVITGITDEGKVLLHDPNGKSYKNAALKKGFEEGFPEEMLQKGFSGAWIYDAYSPPEKTVSRYPDFDLTQEEKDMIAGIIWLEARGEEFEGQQAIAEIIFNRLASGQFNKTVAGTIMADGQFRTARHLDTAQPGALQYKAIEKALSGPYVLPEDVYFFGRTAPNDNVWGKIGGHVFCRSY